MRIGWLYRTATDTTPSASMMPGGEPIHGGRRINGAEAEFVRRVFRAFTTGKSSRAIARDLNAERIAGSRGHRRSDTIIWGIPSAGTGILRNELYLGRLVCNRQALR